MAENFAPIWAVGLMTGTVLDGNIDVALLNTDGESIERFGAYTLAPYPQAIRDTLEETLAQARAWNFEGPEPKIFAEAEDALTRAQSAAVLDLVEQAGLTPEDIGIIGFHGQSVLHRAPQPGRIGATRQLGNGALMRELTVSGELSPGETGLVGVKGVFTSSSQSSCSCSCSCSCSLSLSAELGRSATRQGFFCCLIFE